MDRKHNKRNHEEEFNERAAIMQYEADMSKQDAEKQAMKDMKKYPSFLELSWMKMMKMILRIIRLRYGKTLCGYTMQCIGLLCRSL